jgi:hypothetical protein
MDSNTKIELARVAVEASDGKGSEILAAMAIAGLGHATGEEIYDMFKELGFQL